MRANCLLVLQLICIFAGFSCESRAATLSCGNLFLSPLSSEYADHPDFRERTRHQISENNFVTWRDAREYAELLGVQIGDSFLQSLIQLGARQRWLDGGSGQGLALRAYLRGDTQDYGLTQRQTDLLRSLNKRSLNEKAKVMGITFTDKPGRSRGQSMDDYDWGPALKLSQKEKKSSLNM